MLWAGEVDVYCWGDYDKSCLEYTWRVNKVRYPQLSNLNIYRFAEKMIDLEIVYGYDKIYHKQSLKDILLSLNKDMVIDERKLHHPTYDAEILYEFHKQAQKGIPLN